MPFRHLALQSPCRSIPFRTMRFLCCSLPCSSAALPIVRCLAAADHLPAPRCHCLAIPRRFLASLRSAHASLCTLSFSVAGRCYALAHAALLMAMPMRFLSRQCPCYTVPRFALAHLFCALPSLSDAYHCLRCSARCFALANPGQSLPLPGYESVTIVILKNTEVKSKWIRKRKFGVLHKRRGFVLCVSHKRAGSGA